MSTIATPTTALHMPKRIVFVESDDQIRILSPLSVRDTIQTLMLDQPKDVPAQILSPEPRDELFAAYDPLMLTWMDTRVLHASDTMDGLRLQLEATRFAALRHEEEEESADA